MARQLTRYGSSATYRVVRRLENVELMEKDCGVAKRDFVENDKMS